MFSSLNTIQLVETSEGMMERQRDAVERALEKAGKKLARGEDGEGVRLEWYGSIEGVPVGESFCF